MCANVFICYITFCQICCFMKISFDVMLLVLHDLLMYSLVIQIYAITVWLEFLVIPSCIFHNIDTRNKCYFVIEFTYTKSHKSSSQNITQVSQKFYICNRNLTHCGRDKMDAISQTTFSSAFSWMQMLVFRLKFHWSLFLRVHLTIFQHWFR